MRRTTSTLAFLAICAMLSAQSPRTLTLQESLDLAAGNSAQLKKTQLDRQGLEQRLKDGRNAALPKVNFGVNFDYFPVLPTNFLPGEFFGANEAYLPVQFGKPFQLTTGVSLQQPLYNEALRRAAPIASVSRNIYDLLTERAEEDVRFNTAGIFYQHLQTEQLLRTVDANLKKLASLERIAQLQYANDLATPLDVKRLKVARTNLENQKQNLLTGIGALRQTLQFFCGIPFDMPVQPVDSSAASPAADSARWLAIRLDTEHTTEHRLLQHNIELNRVQARSLRAEGYPTLSAYASGFLQTQRLDANILDPAGRWYGMAAMGFRFDIPVFEGFRRRHKINLLHLEGRKLEEDRRQLAQGKILEFTQAREQLQGALRTLRLQTENVELAKEIVEKLSLQYQSGSAMVTDLLNAQTALSEAETAYWQQVFAYKLAILKLLKAAGRMEELGAN
jgi:outer membrane protein